MAASSNNTDHTLCSVYCFFSCHIHTVSVVMYSISQSTPHLQKGNTSTFSDWRFSWMNSHGNFEAKFAKMSIFDVDNLDRHLSMGGFLASPK